MKILIANAVTLNGGDFAILESMINVLKKTYGDDTEFIVYDFQADISARYYPEINFRTHLYVKYSRKPMKGFSFVKKVLNQFSPQKRLMFAAKFYSKGMRSMPDLLLTKEEKVDFDHYNSADLVVTTGGTYLVENYSLSARIYDFYFTLALKKPLVFFTQSLGPFNKPDNIYHMKKIFDQASLILLRDEASYKNLELINVDVSRSRVCADVVFADTQLSVLKAAGSRPLSEPITIGISVRDWKFFVGRTHEEGLRKYFSAVAAICEYVVEVLGGKVVFISTCQAIEEYHVDDAKTAFKIYDLLTERTKAGTTVNADFHSPTALKKILKEFDMVVSTRMHAAIQSLNLGVPVLPISYEFKTKELFSKLIDKRLILDIDTLEDKDAVRVFSEFLNGLPKTRAHMFEKVKDEHLSALTPVEHMRELLKVSA